MHEQVARKGVLTGRQVPARGAAQESAAADNISPGQHPYRASALVIGLPETRVIRAGNGDRTPTVDREQIAAQRIETCRLQSVTP